MLRGRNVRKDFWTRTDLLPVGSSPLSSGTDGAGIRAGNIGRGSKVRGAGRVGL